MKSIRTYIFSIVTCMCCVMLLGLAKPAAAANPFSVQVYPSPLVMTVKPGQPAKTDIHVRNAGPASESLTITPRAFKVNAQNQQLELSDSELPDIASWISFNTPAFTIASGQTATITMTLAVPENAGFSYAFALTITRANQPEHPSGQTLKAQVAVFSLLNVDRPGAVRKLEVTQFNATKGVYEYLPAAFTIVFKNTGNTIVQPSGTLFIQRGDTNTAPVDSLPVNDAGGYILPGASRTVTVTWAHGFQVMTAKPQTDGSTKDELQWNWDQLSTFRFGKYTAKLVAVYDDGHRDVPLESATTFWVIPWLLLLGILAVLSVIGVGIWSVIRAIVRVSKKLGRNNKKMHF